jgi:hypothetical protein
MLDNIYEYIHSKVLYHITEYNTHIISSKYMKCSEHRLMPSDSIPFGILLDDITEIFLLSKIKRLQKY